jgi:PAS domain S-box-containing protein
VAVKTNDIRRYADELEQSESKYRSLVESAEDLIFTVDLNGVVGTANQHMARLFGAEETGLAERSLYDLLPKDQAYRQVRLIRDAVQSGKRQSIETVFEIRENVSWFNIQYIPVKSEGGGRVQVLGIGRDISERKAFERQLINTEKLASLGTLAAGVAHEINNPLGIMLGFCDLLLEKVDPGTMEYNDLKTIERHGLHCKSIVERLLSFARMSEDVEETCDVNENVEAILAVVRHTLTMNNISLACDLSEGLPAVNGNSRGLQQVLLNLISNAVQAMEKDGTLSISSRVMEEGDWVEIKVSDTGAGVRKEILHKIFDPFFTTKKVGEGTGLGLSVSYGIITNFGGTIQCESVSDRDNPGHSGTTFTVMLPAKGSPRALESAAAAETNPDLQAQMAQDL